MYTQIGLIFKSICKMNEHFSSIEEPFIRANTENWNVRMKSRKQKRNRTRIMVVVRKLATSTVKWVLFGFFFFLDCFMKEPPPISRIIAVVSHFMCAVLCANSQHTEISCGTQYSYCLVCSVSAWLLPKLPQIEWVECRFEILYALELFHITIRFWLWPMH